MKQLVPLLLIGCFHTALISAEELRIPAFTAYLDPDSHGAHVSKDRGITNWHDSAVRVLWFGEMMETGKLNASIVIRLPINKTSKLQLAIAGQKHEVLASNGTVSFGEYDVAKSGYLRIELSSLNGTQDAGEIEALVLDGPAAKQAHFNLEPRRNAASVHLMYPIPKDTKVAMFYNEVTAVEDPVATFYMACGFSRGYFGMQVNSPTERRIIFSVWDSGAGGNAKDRTTVSPEDQTQLAAKGDGVVASVFGNEGTGGHSHLVYPWKTGETQRFVVVAKPVDSHTIYSGYWFHPEKHQWMLIASFKAPKDGEWVRGLHSFSENFGGSNGHLQRKALFGPTWIATSDGSWVELCEARFSHDPTGKANRLDRFMGVENDRFFLSHGGFVPGRTDFGERFTRPATKTVPTVTLPP